MSPQEIDEKIESIAEVSNLGEFLDIPVRHYSTGMYVRLAFATSTAVESADSAARRGDGGRRRGLHRERAQADERADGAREHRRVRDAQPRRAAAVLPAHDSPAPRPHRRRRSDRPMSSGSTPRARLPRPAIDADESANIPLTWLTNRYICSCRPFASTSAWPRSASASRRDGPASASRPSSSKRRGRRTRGLPHAHFLNSATSGLHLAVRLLKERHGWQRRRRDHQHAADVRLEQSRDSLRAPAAGVRRRRRVPVSRSRIDRRAHHAADAGGDLRRPRRQHRPARRRWCVCAASAA